MYSETTTQMSNNINNLFEKKYTKNENLKGGKNMTGGGFDFGKFKDGFKKYGEKASETVNNIMHQTKDGKVTSKKSFIFGFSVLFVMIFGGLIAPNLPKNVIDIMKYPLVKFILLVAIVMLAVQPTVEKGRETKEGIIIAVCLAILFILLMYLLSYNKLDSIMDDLVHFLARMGDEKVGQPELVQQKNQEMVEDVKELEQVNSVNPDELTPPNKMTRKENLVNMDKVLPYTTSKYEENQL